MFDNVVKINIALYMDPYAPLCKWYLPREIIEWLYLSPVLMPGARLGRIACCEAVYVAQCFLQT